MNVRITATAASLGGLVLSASLMALNAPIAAAPSAVNAPTISGAACNSYCTAGVSTNGCQATMSCAGGPSAVATSGFVLTTSGMEGEKNALMRSSITGQNAVPLAANGSSFLCIKAPHQKMGPVQNSSGTSGACGGSIQVDFLAWTTGHVWPLAMDNQFFVQALYTDPPAPKSINQLERRARVHDRSLIAPRAVAGRVERAALRRARQPPSSRSNGGSSSRWPTRNSSGLASAL